MQNTALILIVVTLFLLVIIVGLLTALIFKLMKQGSTSPTVATPHAVEDPQPDLSKSQYHPAILERIKDLEKVKARRVELFCPNHKDEPGEVSCAICDQLFCNGCIKPFKSLHFCIEHIPLIMRHDWTEVMTVKTSTQDPEEGVRVYAAKKKIFEEKDIPTYIETHYKINVDQDYIETYLIVLAIAENAELVKTMFENEVQV
jgi:hypothetical protein